jgi:small subunit ribosomal protein S20
MPHSRSSRKRVRQNEKNRLANLEVRSSMRTQERRVQTLIAEGKLDEAKTELSGAFQRLDKAARVHVIHANTASNHKRKLAKRLSDAVRAKSGGR